MAALLEARREPIRVIAGLGDGILDLHPWIADEIIADDEAVFLPQMLLRIAGSFSSTPQRGHRG